jgi:hypothetical protein
MQSINEAFYRPIIDSRLNAMDRAIFYALPPQAIATYPTNNLTGNT